MRVKVKVRKGYVLFVGATSYPGGQMVECEEEALVGQSHKFEKVIEPPPPEPEEAGVESTKEDDRGVSRAPKDRQAKGKRGGKK